MLGAGASCSYGFPLGSQLRQYLLGAANNDGRRAQLLGVGRSQLMEFVNAFRVASDYSIDAFLGRRWSDFEEVGKAAIAHVLLAGEAGCDLFNETGHGDHWYQYLVNELATESWDTFDPSWLSVVTFNYERSLEIFLCTSLREKYGRSEAEIVDRLRAIKFVHVYGSLGSPWPGDPRLSANESRPRVGDPPSGQANQSNPGGAR